MSTQKNSASKIRDIAREFLEGKEGVSFKRKEIEEYIDSKIKVTIGAKTGALNRLLINNGNENGIKQIKRGVYIYDPSNKNIHQEPEEDSIEDSINEQLIKIMDQAFANAKKVISDIEIIDFLTEEDLDQLAKYRELLKIKSQIDELLK